MFCAPQRAPDWQLYSTSGPLSFTQWALDHLSEPWSLQRYLFLFIKFLKYLQKNTKSTISMTWKSSDNEALHLQRTSQHLPLDSKSVVAFVIIMKNYSTKGKMRPDCVSICRSDGSGEGIGVIHPNIQRGPYGVRDPVMATERKWQLSWGHRAYWWEKWKMKVKTQMEGVIKK